MAVIVVKQDGSGDHTTLAAAVSAAIADDEIEIQGAWTVDDTAALSIDKNLTIRAVGEAKHYGRPFKTGDTHYRFRPNVNYGITISSGITLDLDDVDLQNASTGTSHELIRCTTPGVVINVNRSLCGMASRVDQQDIIYSERGLTVNANNSHFYNAYRAVIDFYSPNSGSDGTFNFNSCTFSRCGNSVSNATRSGIVGYHANSASGTSTVVINMLNCLIDVVLGGVTNIHRATNLNDSVTVNIDNCVTNANTWMQSGNVGVGINTTNDTLSATVTDSTAASAYIVNDLSEATPDLRLTDHANNLAIENHSVASATNSALTMPTDELLKGERVTPYDLGAYAVKCATPRVIGVRSTLQQPDSANHDFAIPSDVVAGNLLMLVSAYNDSNTQTLTDWTTLDSGARAGVFVKSSDGTETVANLTTSPNTQSAGYVLVIDNWSGDINDVEYASIETTTDTPDPPAITAPWGADNNLFGSVIMARRGDNEITAFPTNYDDNQNAADTTSGSGGASIGLATRNLNAASDNPSTFTKANTHVCHAATFVIKPAASGGGGSTTYTVDSTFDSILKKQGITQTASLSAVFQKTGITLNSSVDSILSAIQTLNSDIDAVLKKSGLPISADLNALLQKNGEALGADVEAILHKQGLTTASSIDALLQKQGIVSNSFDSILRKQGILTTATIAGVLQKQVTTSVAFNALLGDVKEVSATLNALLQKTATLNTLVDALLSKQANIFTNFDAVLFRPGGIQVSATIDAIIQKTLSINAVFGAILQRKDISLGVSTDALLLASASLVVSVNALLAKSNVTLSASMSAILGDGIPFIMPNNLVKVLEARTEVKVLESRTQVKVIN